MNSATCQRDVLPGTHYTFNPIHRNKTNGKSQWEIIEKEELVCFVSAQTNLWVCGADAWGLYFIDEKIHYLDIAQDHDTRVFIAKFVNDVSHNNWHGYPADHQRNDQDIPENEILNIWLRNKVLPKAKIKKIAGGKPCKL